LPQPPALPQPRRPKSPASADDSITSNAVQANATAKVKRAKFVFIKESSSRMNQFFSTLCFLYEVSRVSQTQDA
jgi:hypothetical protein